VVLIQLLHGDVGGTMQLDEPLLTAAAEQRSVHVGLLLDLDAGIT
jgi:hypothetical protein